MDQKQQQQRFSRSSESPRSVSVPNVSTELIQKRLEENNNMIHLIMEKQRLGRHDEREMLIEQLQSNLTTMTKLADLMSHLPPRSPPHQMIAEGSNYQEAAQVVVPWSPRQLQDQVQQQQHYSSELQSPRVESQLGTRFGTGRGKSSSSELDFFKDLIMNNRED